MRALMSRHLVGHIVSLVGVSLIIHPLRLLAQSTNGTTTVMQETLSGAGGKVGSSNPMSMVTVAAEPFGGMTTGAGETVWLGYQASLRTLPPGTKTISVLGTVTDASATTVQVNGLPATVTGTTFQATGIQLVEGPNTITAIATDAAGNQATKSITVSLDTQPPARPTVAVTGIPVQEATTSSISVSVTSGNRS